MVKVKQKISGWALFIQFLLRLLRSEAEKLGFPSNFTIYDTQDSDRLIASIIKEMGLDKDLYNKTNKD